MTSRNQVRSAIALMKRHGGAYLSHVERPKFGSLASQKQAFEAVEKALSACEPCSHMGTRAWLSSELIW
jgi:hypothetical protein